MRAIFNQELKQLGSDLESMANQVATAIERAAESLRQGDIVIAEQVIDADERINDLQRDIDDLCVMLLARQQPVAGDLRNVLSALRMAQTLERQGDLARHALADICGAQARDSIGWMRVRQSVRASERMCCTISLRLTALSASTTWRSSTGGITKIQRAQTVVRSEPSCAAGYLQRPCKMEMNYRRET